MSLYVMYAFLTISLVLMGCVGFGLGRPLHVAKETYSCGKRDLFMWQKRPIHIQTHTLRDVSSRMKQYAYDTKYVDYTKYVYDTKYVDYRQHVDYKHTPCVTCRHE